MHLFVDLREIGIFLKLGMFEKRYEALMISYILSNY